MVIGEELDGMGFEILKIYMIEKELRSGEMVMIFEKKMRKENEYYIVVKEGKMENKMKKVLWKWIEGKVGNKE